MYANEARDKTAPAREVGSLEMALAGTGNAIGELADALHRLTDRLQPVLVPEVPIPAPGESIQQKRGPELVRPEHSQHVLQANDQRSRLESLIHRVNDLANRLET